MSWVRNDYAGRKLRELKIVLRTVFCCFRSKIRNDFNNIIRIVQSKKYGVKLVQMWPRRDATFPWFGLVLVTDRPINEVNFKLQQTRTVTPFKSAYSDWYYSVTFFNFENFFSLFWVETRSNWNSRSSRDAIQWKQMRVDFPRGSSRSSQIRPQTKIIGEPSEETKWKWQSKLFHLILKDVIYLSSLESGRESEIRPGLTCYVSGWGD